MKTDLFISFTDKYMSSANHTYCLVYLYGLRFHMENKLIPDNESIAEALRIMDSDVEKAWNYWRKKGLARSERGIIRIVEKVDEKATKKKPTSKEVARRMTEDPIFAWLCKETEARLGGELSSSDISTLQWLYDTTGLSKELLILLADHTSSQGKTMRYMEKVALDWSRSGIDTMEKAQMRLESASPKKETKKTGKKSKFHNFEQRETDYSDIEDEYFDEILKGMKSDAGK